MDAIRYLHYIYLCTDHCWKETSVHLALCSHRTITVDSMDLDLKELRSIADNNLRIDIVYKEHLSLEEALTNEFDFDKAFDREPYFGATQTGYYVQLFEDGYPKSIVYYDFNEYEMALDHATSLVQRGYKPFCSSYYNSIAVNSHRRYYANA